MYFLVDGVPAARRVVDELLLEWVEARRIHVLAKRGTPLEGLPEANLLQKSDFVPAVQRGVLLGGATGILVGLVGLALRLINPAVAGGILLAHAIAGAGVGSWLGGMVGMNIGNTRLERFNAAIESGRILIIADVPRERVDTIEGRVKQRLPDAHIEGLEPLVPPFP
jgi:hypothetical protein